MALKRALGLKLIMHELALKRALGLKLLMS